MNIQDQTLTLSKAELRAFLAHMSTDTTRAYLHGLIVDPSSGRVTATDGHRLLTWAPRERTPIPVQQGNGWRTDAFLLPRAPLEQAAKAARNSDKPEDRIEIHFGAEGAVAKINVGGTVVPFLIEYSPETPPPIEPNIPAHDETTPLGLMALNAAYLADLALVQKAIGRDGVAVHYGPERIGAALVHFAEPEWKAVIMAMNGSTGWDAPKAVIASTAEPAPASEPAPAVAPVVALPPRKTRPAPKQDRSARLRELLAELEGFSEDEILAAGAPDAEPLPLASGGN